MIFSTENPPATKMLLQKQIIFDTLLIEIGESHCNILKTYRTWHTE